MPGTIVKLSSGHARAWAHNQPVWLTESGEIARPVTRSEQHAISRALERTARVNRSFRLDLTLEDVVSTPHGFVRRRAPLGRSTVVTPPPKITCAFEVQVVATKRVVTVWYGALRYATGREVIAAQILADHGECVLHGRNGKCIGVLRDPLVAEREPNYGKRVQYSRTFDEQQQAEEQLALELEDQEPVLPDVAPVKRRVLPGRPGRRITHASPNNLGAADRPAALTGARPGTRPGARPGAKAGGRPAARPAAKPVPRVPPRVPAPDRPLSPDECWNDCRGRKGGQAWSLAKGAIPPTENQHHPVCKYARAWNATLTTPQTSSVLYDLELGRVARSAMPEEIAEADVAERTTTMRNITVAGRLYAVLNRGDADLAEREARGEEPELPPLPPVPAVGKAPTAQLELRAASSEEEEQSEDEPEPDSDEDAEPMEPLNATELRSMLDSDYEPGTDPDASSGDEDEGEPLELSTAEDVERFFEGDSHETPTEPAPPMARSRPLVLIEEPDESAEAEASATSAEEAEREEWPELNELQGGPEAYRRRAEVTASSYLARTPRRLPPQSPHT
jgi:hypothetical protein